MVHAYRVFRMKCIFFVNVEDRGFVMLHVRAGLMFNSSSHGDGDQTVEFTVPPFTMLLETFARRYVASHAITHKFVFYLAVIMTIVITLWIPELQPRFQTSPVASMSQARVPIIRNKLLFLFRTGINTACKREQAVFLSN